MNFAIVGAGVVGLSLAYALAGDDHTVIVFDAQKIPNPSSASYDRSRMMRLQYGPQYGYAQLAQRALASWTELESALGVRLYRPTGVVVWSATSASWTTATSRTLRDIGVPHKRVSPIKDAARFLDPSNLGDGVRVSEGGVLLADRAVTTLASAAANEGVVLRQKTPVVDVDCEHGIVRTSAREVIHADAVIVTVGAWTIKLLPEFATRLTPIRSIVVYVRPPTGTADDWANAPCTMIETRESILYALPPVPGAPLKLAGTANLRQADPDRPEPVSSDEAHAVLETFHPYLHDIKRYRIIGSAMGYYADPPDKTFILEWRKRGVIITGCGGRMFKFAPLLAREVAAVLTGSIPETQLDHWRKPLADPAASPPPP